MRIISQPKKILITSPHHLGDFVAKVPLIRVLKKHFPECEILVLARGYIRDLVDLIEEVDTFLDFDEFFQQESSKVIHRLKSLNLDVCLHLPSISYGYGPNVIRFAKEAGIPVRIGNVKKSYWSLIKKRQFGLTHNLKEHRLQPHLHEFDWNLLPLKFFGISSKQDVHKLLKTSPPRPDKHPALQPDRFNLIVHPGSNGNSKEWPEENYKELIEALSSDVHVILTGTEAEKNRFSDLQNFKRDVQDLRGELTLKELIWLISHADMILTGSTGPIHIASLFETSIVGLYPSQWNISSKIWGPISPNAKVLESPGICLFCQKKLTDYNSCLCECMSAIEVNDVLHAIEEKVGHEDFV